MKRGKYKWRSQGEGEEVRQKTLYIRMMMMELCRDRDRGQQRGVNKNIKPGILLLGTLCVGG